MGKCTLFGVATRGVAVAATVALLGTYAPALAQEEEAPRDYGQKADTLGSPEPEAEVEGPNRGRVSFTVGMDFTTAYFFRGILQERNGFIWQPYAEMAINVYKGDGVVSNVDLGMGIWSSLQTAKTFASGSGPSNLYEVDYYPGVTVGFSNGIETSLTYVVYTGPNGSFDTIQQLDWGLAYDDSELLGDFAFGPTATFSFELDNTSFGTREGGYFELAGAPGIEVMPESDYPLTFAFPLALGLSMYDYYESTDPYHNQTFGFFSFGANVGVPLAFISEDYGEWSANLGITVLALSQTLKQVNDNDNPFPIGTFGISMAY